MALYAAYGSNMDPAQMLARCPHSPQRGTGWLEGWRLTFGGEDIGWDGALTTVVEDAAQRVFVALYDVPEVDEKELDSWDGVTLGFYRKLKVRVQTSAEDGDALAWLYVLDAYEGARCPPRGTCRSWWTRPSRPARACRLHRLAARVAIEPAVGHQGLLPG